MSASITHKDSQPCKCHEQRYCGDDISYNHDTGEIKRQEDGCDCPCPDVRPGKIDALIAQYEALIEEAKKEKKRWEEKADHLDGVAMEVNATANKEEILLAISQIDIDIHPITDEQINALFQDKP